MAQSDQYRIKAAELTALARAETHPTLSAELERLAMSYLRLAEQADRNSKTDVVYESAPHPASPHHMQLQQQHSPPEPKIE